MILPGPVSSEPIPSEPFSSEPFSSEPFSSEPFSSERSTPPSALYNAIAPARVLRGSGIVQAVGPVLSKLGQRPLVIGGDRSLKLLEPRLKALFKTQGLTGKFVSYQPDCCESRLEAMGNALTQHQADLVIGIGGGKALDSAKLVAHHYQRPVITIPTSGATCAAWTALSNVYSEAGAFQYDVSLATSPSLLILDYDLIKTAPTRTLVAGIGDALAKWYEASISSGASQETLILAAVQQARVLRDILLQKSEVAIANPNSDEWRQVVDATVLMAGVIGGLGGAQCRTVAAHAVHNGLTHLSPTRQSLHGEKVAYGILVQLRLEELIQQNQLAASSRQQLLQFYQAIGLPTTLQDLGMENISITELEQATTLACAPHSDLHHLPFEVCPVQLAAAMVSTTAPTQGASNFAAPSMGVVRTTSLAKVNMEGDNCGC